MECVASGLLRKDRFNVESDAFLGRGASAAVSRGVYIDGEVRWMSCCMCACVLKEDWVHNC